MITQQMGQYRIYLLSIFLLVSALAILAAFVCDDIVHSFTSYRMSYLLVAILGLLVFGPILQRIAKRFFDLAEPSIWLIVFYFAHFGVRPISDLMFGSPFLGLDRGETDLGLINTALGMSILGFIFFRFGYQRRVGQAIAHSLPSLPCRWQWDLVLPVALLSTTLGW